MKRKIIAITGARSEYDLLYELYSRLHKNDCFDFSIIITGSHLSEKFGLTGKYVEKDQLPIAGKVYNLVDSDTKIARAISIGNQIPILAQIFDKEKPDMVLVAGDREESVSVTLTAAYMDILVAHFFGGDIAKDGNIDNSARYAASKFAHIHFPTLHQHKDNLLRLGEDSSRIHVVGNPAIDRIVSTEYLSKTQLFKTLQVPFPINDKYVILIQHSIITEVDQQGVHIRETLDAIVESEVCCFLNFPNSDAGSQAIIDAYQEYSYNYPEKLFSFRNLDRVNYVNLLRHASCLLGNSSSGLLEAPSLDLPAINIGSRQRGRIHGDNITFVDNKKEDILRSINSTMDKANSDAHGGKMKFNNPYGDGNSVDQIMEVLTNFDWDKDWIHKDITY